MPSLPDLDRLRFMKEGSVAFHIYELEDGSGRCAVIEMSIWGSKEECEEYCRLAVDTGELFENGRTYH